jgi:hypothetical protein
MARRLREAFPYETAPRFLIHDNDSIFGEAVGRSLRAMGITQVLTSLRSPWQNTYAERVIADDPAGMPKPHHRWQRGPLPSIPRPRFTRPP